ncbi:MAG: hypothetical protein RR626_06655 [Anaerovoracaceae bacterium]
MEKRVISIYTNDMPVSKDTSILLKNKLESSGFCVLDEYDEEAELLVCIGGDGSTLEAIHKNNFPKVPIITRQGNIACSQQMR